MTNSKNHAFLICPANQTGAVGGTPPTRGAAGGQIKKETWEHAFEAALRGLPKAVSGDQALVGHGSDRLKTGVAYCRPVGPRVEFFAANAGQYLDVRAILFRRAVFQPLGNGVVAVDGVAALVQLAHQGGFAARNGYRLGKCEALWGGFWLLHSRPF